MMSPCCDMEILKQYKHIGFITLLPQREAGEQLEYLRQPINCKLEFVAHTHANFLDFEGLHTLTAIPEHGKAYKTIETQLLHVYTTLT